MERISYNPKEMITPVDLANGKRLYVVTHPIRFYTSEMQTLFIVERGFHIDEALLPRVLRKRLKPNGPLGVIAAVYCKLLEYPYLFNEITQKDIDVSTEMRQKILDRLIDQYSTSLFQYHLLGNTFLFYDALGLRENPEINKEKAYLEQQWRMDNPPMFASVK